MRLLTNFTTPIYLSVVFNSSSIFLQERVSGQKSKITKKVSKRIATRSAVQRETPSKVERQEDKNRTGSETVRTSNKNGHSGEPSSKERENNSTNATDRIERRNLKVTKPSGDTANGHEMELQDEGVTTRYDTKRIAAMKRNDNETGNNKKRSMGTTSTNGSAIKLQRTQTRLTYNLQRTPTNSLKSTHRNLQSPSNSTIRSREDSISRGLVNEPYVSNNSEHRNN